MTLALVRFGGDLPRGYTVVTIHVMSHQAIRPTAPIQAAYATIWTQRALTEKNKNLSFKLVDIIVLIIAGRIPPSMHYLHTLEPWRHSRNGCAWIYRSKRKESLPAPQGRDAGKHFSYFGAVVWVATGTDSQIVC